MAERTNLQKSASQDYRICRRDSSFCSRIAPLVIVPRHAVAENLVPSLNDEDRVDTCA
jgi:hypothetical protein